MSSSCTARFEVGFALIAYTLLFYYLFVFLKILPCYFPEQPVNTVEMRFTFSRQYKAVYDNLEDDETKRLTTQIENAVSLTFVYNFTSENSIFACLSFAVKTVAIQDFLFNVLVKRKPFKSCRITITSSRTPSAFPHFPRTWP